MSNIPSISDAFATIVAATEAAIIADTNVNFGTVPKKVYFMHGHPKEIVSVLQQYTASPLKKNSKYPLVILVRDIENEKPTQGNNGFDIVFKCQLFICTITSQMLRAEDRKIRNFDPILHPILYALCTEISKSNLFGMPNIDEMQMEWTDRYFWGADVVDKNKLNDYIDAVEVKSLSLRLYNQSCTILSNF